MYSLARSQRATAHTLQNVSEVNRERFRLAAASSICDSTKHNGLATICFNGRISDPHFILKMRRKHATFNSLFFNDVQYKIDL